jgi:hypothetical protein
MIVSIVSITKWQNVNLRPSQVADQVEEPSISQLEIVTRLEAFSPRTMCWRPILEVWRLLVSSHVVRQAGVLTVTLSIQIMSAPSIVIASPPQT